jgi:hypothetical protein
MESHLNIIGCILTLLAIIHVIFPHYFDWKNELAALSLINKEMMYVHTFFVALVVLLMGILCLTSAQDLIETQLGKTISLGLSFFWFCRLCIQFLGYSKELWQGKKFETTVHIAFSILWIYLSVVFFVNYWV